jgi:hypothetical protein
VAEFDPALINRIAWVVFLPEFEEVVGYLHKKYGKTPVLSWIHTQQSLLNLGKEFKMDGKLYPPRMLENHIQLYDSVRKEDKPFQHKVYQTIMQDETAFSFMGFLKDLEFVNYVDIMRGVENDRSKNDKGQTREEMLKGMLENRDDNLGIISTIVTDLGDEFATFEFGASEKTYATEDGKTFKVDRDNEFEVEKRVTDFLRSLPDELISVFLERLNHGFRSKKGIKNQKYFRSIIHTHLKSDPKKMESMGIPTKS